MCCPVSLVSIALLMRSKTLYLIVLVPVFFLLTAACQLDQAMVRSEAATYEISADSTISIPIYLEKAFDIYAIDVRASFDPALVEVVDADPRREGVQVEPGQFPQPDFVARKDVDTQAGTIHYVMTQVSPTEPANGAGVLFTIQLRGRRNGGETTLHIDQVELSNRSGDLLAVEWQDTILIVEGSSKPETILLTTGVAVQDSGSSQAAAATPTSLSETTSTPLPTLEAATAVQATTESNPTGQPAAEATGVPEQTPRAEDAAAEQGSAQAVPQSAVDSSSEVAVVATAVSLETENSQSEDLQNRPGNEISEAATAVPQNEQIDSSIADSQDLEKAKEPLSVIGENVAAPTPAPVKTAAEGSNAIFPSPVTVVVLIAIIILFILSLAGFFFLRRSA